MNRNNILFLMVMLCIFGLLFFVWTTQGSSINYISENLQLSTKSVQRIYEPNNFYWKLVINVQNTGQTDAILSTFYLSGSKASSAMVPPRTGGFSFETLSIVIKPGETRDFIVSIDSACSLAALDKITVSAYSGANKMYNLVVHLI